MQKKLLSWFSRGENLIALKAIQKGLTLTLPVLLIGSFCIIFLNFPLSFYQEFISNNPLLVLFFQGVYDVTLGAFSLYVALGISVSYVQEYAERKGDIFRGGAPFAVVGAYLLLVGMGTETFSLAVLSTRSLFIAILVALIGSALYCGLVYRFRYAKKSYGNTVDRIFDQVLTGSLPVALIILSAGVLNTVVGTVFQVGSVEELLYQGIDAFFPSDTASFESGLLYLFLNNLMWFFGIHGGNMLDGVAQSVFLSGTAGNAQSIAVGLLPGQLVTKTFMDVFASIGGSGALFSLLLAIVLFGRRRNIKKLAGFASVPMLFNINELMFFGFPIVGNPTFMIPFVLVPLVNFTVAYGATVLGFVPYVTVDVSWITPPFIGGYLATGSYGGAILQGVNLLLGVLIYTPFLRFYEKSLDQAERDEYHSLLSRLRESERENKNTTLTSLVGTQGALARALANDLRQAINEESFNLYYQPQFDASDRGIGAEALLRWNHPVHGMMYPPLVIKLADEIGLLEKLEQTIMKNVLGDVRRIQDLTDAGTLPAPFTLSVNVSVNALKNEDFDKNLIRDIKTHHLGPGHLVIEATEHEALHIDDAMMNLLNHLVEEGILFAIDDFSMGHTSIKYLETSIFSVVKLDGSLARGVLDNKRSAEIVASITRLSKQLHFKVLAEYVETKEQRDYLEKLGCTHFQGYLYSPAVSFEDMIARVS